MDNLNVSLCDLNISFDLNASDCINFDQNDTQCDASLSNESMIHDLLNDSSQDKIQNLMMSFDSNDSIEVIESVQSEENFTPTTSRSKGTYLSK